MKAACAMAIVLATSVAGHDVPGAGTARPMTFRHDVLPHLQRAGCSSAYCHGSATGQGGFKLSLFGGDPVADFGAITQELGGRRVDHDRPAQSLLLRKALGGLEHGGGRVLVRDGAAHRTIAAWLDAGAPWVAGGHTAGLTEPTSDVNGIELERDGDRLVVHARFGADREDVTTRATFTSTDSRVLAVDADGGLRMRGPGRAFAIARFLEHTARLEVVQPFGEVGATTVGDGASTHPLDRAWARLLGALALEPAAPAAPERLARRLHLDVAGRPPTPAELDRFVATPDVAATVRALGRSDAFRATWASRLARWFERTEGDARAVESLANALARGDGLRTIAASVARGELPFVASHADARDRADYAARTLLGVRVACARCHDHPEDRWRRAEHQAFAAGFAPPRAAPSGGMAPGVLFDDTTGRPVAKRWLPLPGTSAAARDGDFATFVLDRGHGQLARNLANRVFAELAGRGLVEPLDDHRTGNPPLDEGLLAALAAELDRTGGDLVELLVFVATSRWYALDSDPGSSDSASSAARSRAPGSGDPRSDDARDERSGDRDSVRSRAATARAVDGDARAAWLAARAVTPLAPAAYARAVAAVTGNTVRHTLPAEPLARALALRNGPFLRDLLDVPGPDGGTRIDALFDGAADAEERLRGLWRATLSRAARPDEVAAFLPQVQRGAAAFRDLAHALLLGREFGERR